MRKNLTIFKIKRFKSFFGTRLYCSSVLAIVELLKKDFEQKRPPSLIRIASVIFLLSRITDVFLLQFPEKLLCKKKFCRFLFLTDEPSEKVKMNRWRTCHSKTTVFENTSKLSHQVQFSPNSSKIGFVEERLFSFKRFYFFSAQQSFF